MTLRTEFCGSSHRIMFIQFVAALLFLGLPCAESQEKKFYTNITDMSLLVDETRFFKLVQIGEFNETLDVNIKAQHADIVQFVPPSVVIPGVENPNSTVELSYDICAYGKSPGHSEVCFHVTPSGIVNMEKVFLLITVMHSHAIYIISNIAGWIYFVAWSVSFYPQIYYNFKRKSVVGLNYDYLALNLMAFILYSLFNCGMYFSKDIQIEYFTRHPRSFNPVQVNDVFFSLHASFATTLTIIQCFIYQCKNQQVSIAGRGLLGVGGVMVLVTASLVGLGNLAWLDFLYVCSYIKLFITLIKYVPQAYMNYRRQSTEGWSIGNVVLDFLGGIFSILQMTLNAYNYNDWISFFGDATKFGLGLFSLVFDIFFMLQHYVFYRVPEIINDPTDTFWSAVHKNLDTISSQVFQHKNVMRENRKAIKKYVGIIHEITEHFLKEIDIVEPRLTQVCTKCMATQTVSLAEYKPYVDGSALTINTETQTDFPARKNSAPSDTTAIIRDTIREEFRRFAVRAAVLVSGDPVTNSEIKPGSYVSVGSCGNPPASLASLNKTSLIRTKEAVITPAETLEASLRDKFRPSIHNIRIKQ